MCHIGLCVRHKPVKSCQQQQYFGDQHTFPAFTLSTGIVLPQRWKKLGEL
mgnify:CR=1 FL=1